MKNNIKKITTISILIALACILSLFDRTLTSWIILSIPYLGAMAPGFKLGIANIVVLIIIYNYDWKYSLLAVLLKSTIAGLIYAGMTNFLIGLAGTLLSYATMMLFKKILKKDIYMIYVSAIGGFFHALGQLIVVLLIYQTKEIFSYFPVVLLAGLITGIIIGIISLSIYKVLNRINKGENK